MIEISLKIYKEDNGRIALKVSASAEDHDVKECLILSHRGIHDLIEAAENILDEALAYKDAEINVSDTDYYETD